MRARRLDPILERASGLRTHWRCTDFQSEDRRFRAKLVRADGVSMRKVEIGCSDESGVRAASARVPIASPDVESWTSR